MNHDNHENHAGMDHNGMGQNAMDHSGHDMSMVGHSGGHGVSIIIFRLSLI